MYDVRVSQSHLVVAVATHRDPGQQTGCCVNISDGFLQQVREVAAHCRLKHTSCFQQLQTDHQQRSTAALHTHTYAHTHTYFKRL